MNDDLITLEEAQQGYFKGLISRWMLYKLVESSQIPCIKMGTGKRARIFFRRSTLDTWLAQKEKESLGQQEPQTYGVLRVANK